MATFDEMWDSSDKEPVKTASFDKLWDESSKPKKSQFDQAWDAAAQAQGIGAPPGMGGPPPGLIPPPPPMTPTVAPQQIPQALPVMPVAPVAPTPQPPPKAFNLGATINNWVQQQPIVQETRQTFGREGLPGLGREAMQTAENVPVGWGALADAAGTGIGMAQDAALNAIPDGAARNAARANLDQQMGAVRHPHVAETLNKWINPNSKDLPEAAKFGKMVGEFSLPVGGTLAAEGNLAKNLAVGSAQAGGLNTLLGATERYQQTHQFDKNLGPGLGDFAAGFAGNALGVGVLKALGATPKIGGAVLKSILNRFGKLSPKQQELAVAAAKANHLPVDQFLQHIGADASKLPPETQAAINDLRAKQGAPATTAPVVPPAAHPAPPVEPKLPRDLRGAKPRFRNWTPKFEHDLDRALYIVGNRKNLSSADDRYYQWVHETTGWDHEKIMAAAQRVKESVKAQPKTSEADFNVPGNAREFGLPKKKPHIVMTSEHAMKSQKHLHEIVDEAKSAHEPVTAAAKVSEWAENLTGEKPKLDENPPEAEFRRTITQPYHGRNKNQLAEPLHGHAYMDTPEMREAVNRIAGAKLKKDYTGALVDKYNRQFWDKFVDQDAKEYTGPNGVKLTRTEVFKRTAEAQQKLDAEYDKRATGVEPTKSPTIESLATQKFGKGSKDAYIRHEDVPNDEAQAAQKLVQLHDQAKAAEKAYDAVKPANSAKNVDALEKKLETAKASKKPDNEKILKHTLDLNDAKEVHQVNQDTEDMFSKMEARKQKETGDVTAAMHVKVDVPHPLGEQLPPVEVGVVFRKGAMNRVVPKEGLEDWEAFKSAIDAKDANRVPTPGISVNARGVARAAVATLTSAFSAVKAEAATHGTRALANPDFFHLWNQFPGNELLGTALVIHKLAPMVAKSIMNDNGRLFKLSYIWKDTMDHVGYADRLLNDGRSLTREIWNHLGQVLRASHGIEFDEQLKMQGMQALRYGEVTPQDALNGVGPFANMTQPQRNSLSMWKIANDNMRRLATERIENLKAWKLANPQAKQTGADDAIEALQHIQNALGGSRATRTKFDNMIGQAVANWMDSMFFWNPDFHGVNLTDAFIAGGAAVGPRNVWRAHADFISDPEVKALFKDSNLIGGYKYERNVAAVNVGPQKKGLQLWTKHDIPSDLVNADRVFYAHLLQYAQTRKSQLAGIGFTGTDKEFAKALLQGKIDPTITMDVWAEGAEKLSRTMGVDPYQINVNFVSRSLTGRALNLFVKQPARVSRLAMTYLQQGDMKKFYTMMGYTMALGGRAAIPPSLIFFGSLTNPDSAFKAAAACDDLDLYNAATGEKMTPKLTWDLLWPTMAVANPLSTVIETAGKAGHGLLSGNAKEAYTGISQILPMFKPRVFGAPLGLFLRGGKAIAQAAAGEKPLYAQDAFGRLVSTDTAQLDTPYDKLRHVARAVVPGRDPQEDIYQMSEMESAARDTNLSALFGVDSTVPQDQQWYNRDGGVLHQGYNAQPDLLGAFLRGKKK